MDNAFEPPLILGRPFLATRGALIDVGKGKLTFRVGSETQDFNVFCNSNLLSNDKYVNEAKDIKSCCMLALMLV